VLYGTRGGRDVLRSRVDPSLVELVDRIEPVPMQMVWSGNHTDGTGADIQSFGGRSEISLVITRIDDSAGYCVGSLIDYRPAAGMSQVFSSMQLADLRHVERMNAVARPGRRPGAILFADLESSTPLSKRVSTAQYFAFGRRLIRGMDQCLINHGAIVGRHAGDGVAGFFLAETAGSESAAARSCIEAARALPDAISAAVERSDLQDETVIFRFGLHWGARLYVGQIQTAGRSEVTALGDEVNDAARIEACASGARTLASKDLLECLTDDDAEALGIDIHQTKYSLLADLPTATDKARRDAPAIAVCEL
jgi:class 3 adenylate cyclase